MRLGSGCGDGRRLASGAVQAGGTARRATMSWRSAVVAAACGLLAAHPAMAQRTGALVVTYSSPTLKRIDETRIVRLGHRENSPPFAFLDAKKKPIGYSLDLCEIVVEEIAKEVGKDLEVEYRPVTPENRFEMVATGAIDLECGSSTNTAERRKVVAFSPTIFVTGTKLLVRRGGGIRSLRDLEGKTIVLTRATVHEAAIPKLAARQKLSINFIFAADHNESFRLLA